MYDAIFYLVTDDASKRLGDPGTELFDETGYVATKNDVMRSANRGGDIQIVMLTPDAWETVYEYLEAGLDINWEDPGISGPED